MDELRDKIARLPAWAREHIKMLETRSQPLVEEAARCRQAFQKEKERATRLHDANSALLEILNSASRGGSEIATTIVKVLEGYEIFRTNEKG